MSNGNGGAVVTGEDKVRLLSMLALRTGLSLEIRTGMTRRGRPSAVIANEYMGTSVRSKRATYTAFNKWLVENYGAEDKPLD